MKTTIEIEDQLLTRARRHARQCGRTLRSLVEEGLSACLDTEDATTSFRLPDRSVGKRGGANPLDSLSWQDLRDEIYGGR